MENQKKSFNYTYSAKQQEEVKAIRRKYLPAEENKMEQLRKLDRQAAKPGTIGSLAVGIIGALMLGVGMCCTMVWLDYFVLGIVVGIVGIAAIALAFPVFRLVTKKQREKLAPEIMRLSDELLK